MIKNHFWKSHFWLFYWLLSCFVRWARIFFSFRKMCFLSHRRRASLYSQVGEVFSPLGVTRNCSLQFLYFINNEKYKIRDVLHVYVLVRFEPFDEYKLMVNFLSLPKSFEGHLTILTNWINYNYKFISETMNSTHLSHFFFTRKYILDTRNI